MGGFGGAGGDAGGLGNIDFSKLGGLDPSALGAMGGEGGFGAEDEGEDEGEDVCPSISQVVFFIPLCQKLMQLQEEDMPELEGSEEGAKNPKIQEVS